MAEVRRAAAALAAAFTLLAAHPARAADAGWAESAAAAWREARPLPPPVVPPTDLDAAYRLQRAFVAALLGGQRPAGFKAGLTSRAARARLGAREPVAGVLLPQGQLPPDAVADLARHPGLHLEVEVGFRLGRAVSADDPAAALPRAVEAMVAVIELPDVRFAAPGPPSPATLIALDAAARYHVVGPVLGTPATLDPDRLEVALTLDGEPVARGVGTNAMGGQWRALEWLVSRTLASGWALEPGQVLITGTLTGMTRARPGRWCARYDGVERLCVTLK